MGHELRKEQIEKRFKFLFKKYDFEVDSYKWTNRYETVELESEKLKIDLMIVKEWGFYSLYVANRKYYTIRWHDFEMLYEHFILPQMKSKNQINPQSLDDLINKLKLSMDQIIELFSDKNFKAIIKHEELEFIKNKQIDMEKFGLRFGRKTADSITQSLDLIETEGQKVRDIDLKIVNKIQQGRRLTPELIAEIIEESPLFSKEE